MACEGRALGSSSCEFGRACDFDLAHFAAQQRGRSKAPQHEMRWEGEDSLRRALAEGELQKVEKGRGGRSLGFKITLADGTRGYFKPEQTFSAAHWYSEVAAYYIDRALGFGRVAPTVGRRFPWAALRKAAGSDPRVDEVVVGADGEVRGSFVAWVEEGVHPFRMREGWERWIRIQPPPASSPYQRPIDYVRSSAAQREGQPLSPQELGAAARSEAEVARYAPFLSDLIVFDYLISNVDRWGGDFTNVRTRGKEGGLLFFDNGAGFWPKAEVPLMEMRLKTLQRFRRRSLEALEALDRRALEEALSHDALAPVLTPRDLDGLFWRRDRVLQHAKGLHERFGAQTIAWP